MNGKFFKNFQSGKKKLKNWYYGFGWGKIVVMAGDGMNARVMEWAIWVLSFSFDALFYTKCRMLYSYRVTVAIIMANPKNTTGFIV